VHFPAWTRYIVAVIGVLFLLNLLIEQHPSWLPVDYAGNSIAEIVLRQDPPKSMVYHIVNPNISASWDDILVGLKDAGLEFETVEKSEWLGRLAASDKDPERNPLIKLFVRSQSSLFLQTFG
jgi:hypothetical protein